MGWALAKAFVKNEAGTADVADGKGGMTVTYQETESAAQTYRSVCQQRQSEHHGGSTLLSLPIAMVQSFPVD